MMKGIAKLGVILAMFAAGACAALAVVYSVTAERIDAQAQIQLEASLKEIFPDADAFEDIGASVKSADAAVNFKNAYLVKGGGAPVGVAVKAGASSYGGEAILLVGTTLDRRIAGVRVLEHKDTPGLGANAANPGYYVNKADKVTFPGQFNGKVLTDAFVVKQDVVAITASTITSKALTGIVKAAGAASAAYLESTATAGGK